MPASYDGAARFKRGRCWCDGDAFGTLGRWRVVSLLLWQLGGNVSFRRCVPVAPDQPDVRLARVHGRPKSAGVERELPSSGSAAQAA